MSASLILISRFSLAPLSVETIRPGLIDSPTVRYLISADRQELLQLRAYDSIGAFAQSADDLASDRQRFAPVMTGDVRRELLQYVEAPKPAATPLPQDDHLQLRHVEVPPQREAAYRAWREETIFQVVRESPLVQTFLAYHSIISGQPGVMFLSGFTGDPQKYLSVFSSERYQEIVRQAGDRYITGGTDGLYTRLYSHPKFLAA
jgi:hypothetical protein